MMTDRDIQRLVLENARLRGRAMPTCRGCAHLFLHPCGAFMACPMLGAVDPDKDGCTKRRPRTR